MAKPGFIGLTYRDGSGRTRQTKFNWSKPHVKRLIGDAAAIALQKAGMECRRSTQRMMVGGSTKTGRVSRKVPVWRQYGMKDGYPLVAAIRKVARPDKVSSWAPMAWLRNDIQSDFDAKTQSVVIGPHKSPWLNQLHEFGGTVNVYLVHQKYPVTEFAGKKIPRKMQADGKPYRDSKGKARRRIGAYAGWLSNYPIPGATRIGSRKVNGRGYMEIGLQAMIHKIPAQFQNTIRTSGGSVGK